MATDEPVEMTFEMGCPNGCDEGWHRASRRKFECKECGCQMTIPDRTIPLSVGGRQRKEVRQITPSFRGGQLFAFSLQPEPEDPTDGK